MTFRLLTRGAFAGRKPLTTPTMSVSQNGQTAIAIPIQTLRDAGLPDTKGATVDVLIGEGENAGRIAVRAGTGFKLSARGNSTVTLTVQFSGYGTERFKAAPVAHVGAHGGSLILTVPAGFPLTKAAAAPVAYSAEARFAA